MEFGEREAGSVDRVGALERRLRRTQLALAGVVLVGVGAVFAAAGRQAGEGGGALKEVRTERLVVVDDAGVARVVIGQDPVDGERRSRAAGITIHDSTGHERGGMGTFDDGSVALALDAPHGVGHAMRDRAGMMVAKDGSASFMLIDNQTHGVAKLISDGKGGGGFQLFKWGEKDVKIKTIGFDGEKVEEWKLGSW